MVYKFAPYYHQDLLKPCNLHQTTYSLRKHDGLIFLFLLFLKLKLIRIWKAFKPYTDSLPSLSKMTIISSRLLLCLRVVSAMMANDTNPRMERPCTK